MKRFWLIGVIALLGVSFAVVLYGQNSSPTPIVIQAEAPRKELLDYILIVVQLTTLIALIVYVVKTWQIASASRKSAELSEDVLKEMRASRLQEIAPYVLVYFDMPYDHHWVMYLVVKNTGRTVAKDIKFKFDPPLVTGFTRSGEGTKPFDIYLLREGISSLAPGQEIRTPFDVHSTYLKDKLPTVYKVQVSYADGLQPIRTVLDQTLDVSIFNDLSVLQKKGEEDLIKAVDTIASSAKELNRHVEKISASLLRGLWINNPEILTASFAANEPEPWRSVVTAKLREIELLWRHVHAGSFERPLRLWTDELQSRLAILASQLLLTTSHAPPIVPSEISNSLIEIAVGLYELSKAPFYADGGESARNFNSSGDETIQVVARLITQLEQDQPFEKAIEAPETLE